MVEMNTLIIDACPIAKKSLVVVPLRRGIWNTAADAFPICELSAVGAKLRNGRQRHVKTFSVTTDCRGSSMPEGKTFFWQRHRRSKRASPTASPATTRREGQALATAT